MTGGRGSRERPRPRARAQAAAVRPPRPQRSARRVDLARLAPSARSVAAGLLLLLAGGGAYGIARSTSAFALTRLDVHGAPSHVVAEVGAVLAAERGRTLVALDVAPLEARLERLPWVADASLDRSFPHTLSVAIVPERPAAVLRQGAASWLVAASGRVLEPLERGSRPALPRIWLKRDVEVEVGRAVPGTPRDAVRAVAPLTGAPFPARVASVRVSDDELTLVLRSGFEIRLGDISDRELKLEIARRILPSLEATGYLDVSVPKHPVAAASLDPQLEVESTPSSAP